MSKQMNEHLQRLIAMRDDEGLTWDLSNNDQHAFAWAITRIAALEHAIRTACKQLRLGDGRDVALATLEEALKDD